MYSHVGDMALVTLFSQVRLVYLIFAVPQTQEQTAINETVTLLRAIFVIFDSAGDSTGGVKDEKAVTCLSKHRRQHGWTCPRHHGNLCFVLLNSLMSALFLSLRRRDLEWKTTSLSGPWPL